MINAFVNLLINILNPQNYARKELEVAVLTKTNVNKHM